MKRVLIYSHDTFGLGNIRRMLEVARHLVQSSSAVSVLVVTGSPMLHAFRMPRGIDYLKLPCLSRDLEGRYGARFLDMSLDATVRMRANLIRTAIADFAPDLVLVDKKPFGVEDELSGALAEMPLAAGRPRPRLVLLLRDILDSPQETLRVWRKNGCFEAIEAYYDEVLVLGSQAVFDVGHEYAFPPFAAAKLRYCGYIAREPGRLTRGEARRALGLDDDRALLLVTPGGGEDGYALVATAIEMAAAMPVRGRPRLHVVCGPEMAEAQRETIRRAAAALPHVSLQDFSDDMMSLLAAADVVLAMAGYNTVCELMSLRKRAVVVPRTRPGQEQCIRAERLARLGLLRVLHPARLSAAALWAEVRGELRAIARRTPLPRLPSQDGLEHCSAAILDQVDLPPLRPTSQPWTLSTSPIPAPSAY